MLRKCVFDDDGDDDDSLDDDDKKKWPCERTRFPHYPQNGTQIDCSDVPGQIPHEPITRRFAKATRVDKFSLRFRQYLRRCRFCAVVDNMKQRRGVILESFFGRPKQSKTWQARSQLYGFYDMKSATQMIPAWSLSHKSLCRHRRDPNTARKHKPPIVSDLPRIVRPFSGACLPNKYCT